MLCVFKQIMTFIGRAEAIINGRFEDLQKLRLSGVYSNTLFLDGTRNFKALPLCTSTNCGRERILREVERVSGVELRQSGIIYCSNCPQRESD